MLTNSGLFIIDAQRGFLSKRSSVIINPLHQLLAAWGSRPLAWSKFINYPDSPWQHWLDWPRVAERPETDIIPQLAPYAHRRLVLEKSSYSSLTPAAQEWITEQRLDTLLLAGISTESCVLATALAAFDARIRPVIITDCCASKSRGAIDRPTKALLEKNFGRRQLLTSKQILALL